MANLTVSIEDLLAGAATTHVLEIPDYVITPGRKTDAGNDQPLEVEIKPLTIGAFQLIAKAAREDPGLVPILMIKEALVKPLMNPAQIANMPIGLVDFLIENIRQLSGLTQKKTT